MAINFLNLPALQDPGGYNFKPLADGFDAIREGKKDNRLLDIKQQGQDLDKSRFGLQERQFGEQQKQAAAERLANQAMAVDQLQGPARAAAYQRVIAMHPDAANLPEPYRDPINGPKLIAADYGRFRDQLAEDLKRSQLAKEQAQIGLIRAQTADAGRGKVVEVGGQLVRVPSGGGPAEVVYGADPTAQRRKQLEAAGIDPTSSQGKVFIASGKMPREDQQPLTATDKKAILEADEQIANTQGVMTGLKEATTLSKDAYTGPTANIRGYLGSLFGLKGAEATQNLTNVVSSQALQSLKAVFGGNPTEGERKALLDLQGSADKAPAVREAIYQRALALAERRLEMNKQRATELRGGTFYKPQGQKTTTPEGWSIERVE